MLPDVVAWYYLVEPKHIANDMMEERVEDGVRQGTVRGRLQ